jgi:predicted TIM-barrel fold metal-dependent hydrolase
MKKMFVFVFLLPVLKTFSQEVTELKLENYRPEAIYKIPITKIEKAKFPVIDMHSHDYAKTDADVDKWVRTMDSCNIEKTIILSGASGAKFDSLIDKYSRYGNRFELWCGFDIVVYQEAGWSDKAVKELERCVIKGERGFGELSDKGFGLRYKGGFGPHIDDPIMKPLLKKCAELGIPINIHVAEPIWMYLKMDSTNDGLMNAYKWKIDSTKDGILGHDALVKTLENAVRENPKTTFIACHYANCEYDLSILARMFDKYPNLYADGAARFGEVSPIPRYMQKFYDKYQDRLVYGTDNDPDFEMYEATIRILETLDEHFYYYRSYHWPSQGFGLSNKILKKVYRDNANKLRKK